jgi:hypothetical protein
MLLAAETTDRICRAIEIDSRKLREILTLIDAIDDP